MLYQGKLLGRPLCVMVGLAVLSSCISMTSQRKEESRSHIKNIHKEHKESPQIITQGQLREEVQRFAYRFGSHVNEPLSNMGGVPSHPTYGNCFIG